MSKGAKFRYTNGLDFVLRPEFVNRGENSVFHARE